jgi:hypothetical protein
MATSAGARRWSGVFALSLAIVLSAHVASAETIRYTLKGTIAAINIDNTFVMFVDRTDGMAVGNPFQVSFTFDTSVPDGFTLPTVGSYLQTVPPFALSLSMGGLTLLTTITTTGAIERTTAFMVIP